MDGGIHGEEDHLVLSPPEQARQHYASRQHLSHHGHHPFDRSPVHQQAEFHPHESSYKIGYEDQNTWSQPTPPAARVSGPSYAQANFQAFAANAAAAASKPPTDRYADSKAVDPDDFYRNYRGVQTANAGHQPLSPAIDASSMASAISSGRQIPSVRATTNGTTSKHPPVLAARNNGVRPSFRSASNPVDDRGDSSRGRSTAAVASGYGGVAHQSVKDLKKKFDQQNASQNGPAVRKAIPRNPPSREPSVGPPPRATGGANSKTQYSALRTSTTAAAESSRIPGSRATQRQKSVPEDQLSSNSQSFASRISKPRSTVTTNPQASKSTSYLLADTSPIDLTTSPPIPRSNPLLFGEILPEQNDSVTAGFGIGVVRPRRTSDSNLPSPSVATHQRSLSDPDVLEPSSPTDWYRTEPLTQQRNEPNGQHVKVTKGHGRAHSDLVTAGTKPTIPRLQHVPIRPRQDQRPPSQPTSPTSRLPRSVKKFNTSSNSAASTRSNSPSTAKRPPANGRTSRQNGTPPFTRAKTPTSRSHTPTTVSKTSTHNPGSTRRTPAHINTANSNSSSNRLNAYVSIPQPKLSPSLRSSRPRQSVASATTASSRMKAIDRAQSPSNPRSRAPSRGPSRQEEPSLKRPRKISVGPIDFAQRRETIKLAYSRSIRESRALEARQTAAERRKKELETVARTKLEAEAVVTAALAISENEAASQPTRAAVQRKDSRTEVPLKIVTDLSSVQAPSTETSRNLDSPTLGMPGGFPGPGSPSLDQVEEEIPQSAVSIASVVTEFDIEPQTEPATQESTTTIDDDLGFMVQKPPVEAQPLAHVPSIHHRASYHYPFEEEEGIHDETARLEDAARPPSSQPSHQPTPTRMDFEPLPTVPGSFEEHDYEVRPYTQPPIYETKVTILSRDQDFIPVRLSTGTDDEMDPYGAHIEQYPPTVTNDPRETDGHVIAGLNQEPGMTRDSLESFYAAPRLQDNIAALRQSTLSSSDRDASLDGNRSASDSHRTPDTAHSLTVPPLLTPANRLSHASIWTDFSFGSAEDPDVPTKGYSLPGHASDYRGRKSMNSSQAPSDHGFRDSSYEEITHSTEISPRDITAPIPSIRPNAFLDEPQLPELDTGAGFSIPYLSREPAHGDELRSPLPPDHSPPPVPDEYELDENAYYNDTRPSSYLRNDEESEGVPQPASTPHSVEKMSLDTTDSQSMTLVPSLASVNDLPGMSDKETRRLKQRQLVIKELIDTEDTFIRDMSVVEEIYKGTAEACPNLDAQTVKIIFRNSGEIIAFHTAFLAQLKEGVTSVYVAKGRRSPLLKQESAKNLKDSDAVTVNSVNSSGASSLKAQLDDGQDRKTSVGPVFSKNVEKLRAAHEGFLRTSDTATKRLIQIQDDTAVKVWLSECNEVAKELTTAWNLDSLLIKPMQRITKYPNLIAQLLEYTPPDHPDREALVTAKMALENAILDINKTKKNFELVGQIVGRKRKESDVKAGIARAFGKRVDKLQTSGSRIPEDAEYLKHHEKFGDDYLRLQVVLRDYEYYTRTVSSYVHEFLQYLSSMELVMRLQPSKHHGHLESKWVQFNVSMRDLEKVLEQHLMSVRKDVIEPFESVIRCYGNPSLAMKKRAKRRLDYEKSMQLKNAGKKVDKQLVELVEQYEALNETLKKELPRLSDLTAKVGNICLGKFVAIQVNWYSVWKEKVKAPLQDASRVPEWTEIISAFQTDFKMMEEEAMTIGILNPALRVRTSQSTTDDSASTYSKTRSRAGDLTPRNRGLSINSDSIPSLPTPEFPKRNSGNNFAISPGMPSPNHSYYRDYYSGINSHSRGASSPITPIIPAPVSASMAAPPRPSTGRSHEPTSAAPRPSVESTSMHSTGGHSRRDSSSTYNSPYPAQEQRRFSGLFHSALPLPDNEERDRSSRASSRERPTNSGYNVLWLAASLFEFNIETTKIEAGYPYLTYQAGEIFDVIAEKGELWLAKNQDDPRDQVGWIWSKHFAKLADS
ncbi:hypothetical protein CONLIGDRAFT_6637 [Coniochaeta ligniaria NRRL 30616]|uniref:DH domain-containing protein n=1 Tax=Coniochaeta ligniaria NRRL 30616 TaxID=1408157 RepID=A0A1J7K2U3_9PEZI|nr:hypothetical protein CONLIGDRAFT_6637 [Coniochaeta ligniaria NRRL 30616]